MDTEIEDFDIEWLQWFDEKAKTDLFFCEGYEHSPVCIVSGNGKRVLIACDGEMRIVHKKDGDDFIIRDFWDLQEIGVNTDDDLVKLEDSFIDFSPWLDAYDITKRYAPEDGVESFEHLDMVSGEIDEILEKVKIYLKETK